MDPRWERPALTGNSTINEIGDVATRMDSVNTMFTDVYMWMLQEGTGDKAIEALRNSFDDLHVHERASRLDEEPYDEAIIRTVHTAAIVFVEIGEFLKRATREFIVDFEVENGGES